jgi:hypothetical protein
MARWRLISAAALCAVLLAACGDSGGLGDTKAASDNAAATTAKTSTASANGSGNGNSGAGSGTPTADCLAGTNAFIAASSSLALVLGGDDKSFESSVAELNKWAGSAPAAISKDLKVVAAAYTSYAKAWKDAGYKAGAIPDANLIKAMEKANAVFDSSEFEKANANVDAWFEKECKS